jgi:hypothetical protein
MSFEYSASFWESLASIRLSKAASRAVLEESTVSLDLFEHRLVGRVAGQQGGYGRDDREQGRAQGDLHIEPAAAEVVLTLGRLVNRLVQVFDGDFDFFGHRGGLLEWAATWQPSALVQDNGFLSCAEQLSFRYAETTDFVRERREGARS